MEHCTHSRCSPLETYCKVSWGGLYYVKFDPVAGVSVTCVEPVCLYRVEPMPLVRPPSPGLTWGTFPGVMSRLRRDRKVGHGIVIIP